MSNSFAQSQRPPGHIAWRCCLRCVTFPLIWVGGLVTTYDAGMAVPDWPGTYGYNLFAVSLADLARRPVGSVHRAWPSPARCDGRPGRDRPGRRDVPHRPADWHVAGLAAGALAAGDPARRARRRSRPARRAAGRHDSRLRRAAVFRLSGWRWSSSLRDWWRRRRRDAIAAQSAKLAAHGVDDWSALAYLQLVLGAVAAAHAADARRRRCFASRWCFHLVVAAAAGRCRSRGRRAKPGAAGSDASGLRLPVARLARAVDRCKLPWASAPRSSKYSWPAWLRRLSVRRRLTSSRRRACCSRSSTTAHVANGSLILFVGGDCWPCEPAR